MEKDGLLMIPVPVLELDQEQLKLMNLRTKCQMVSRLLKVE
jgi:hypothetical protein